MLIYLVVSNKVSTFALEIRNNKFNIKRLEIMEKVNGITEFLNKCKEKTISFLLTHNNMLNDENHFVFEEV